MTPLFKGIGSSSSGGSAVALAKFNGALVALVADEDDNSVHVFETKPSPKEIAVAKVPGTPGQILVTKSGQVLVSLRDKGQVAVLEPKAGDPRQLVQRAAIDTGGEPIALATTPDEATLVVGSAFTHEISAWTLADRMAKFRVDVSREPRALAISHDGAKAFVTHAVGGTISVVDIANGTATVLSPQGTIPGGSRTRVATQGFAIVESGGKMYVPTVMADPETPETYYGSSMETFGVVVVDEGTNAVTGTLVTPNRSALEKCLLPRAAAVVQGRLLVGCAGETEMPMVDATSDKPMENAPKSRSLGDSPSAMAFDDASQMLIVWSQMNRTFTAASFAPNAGPAANLALAAIATPIQRGRKLFHDVTGKVANDGRACASCHTDGRDDGLVWNTPEGNRQTPTLAGRLAGTAPYGWTRNAKTFGEYVKGTIQRLNGMGFNDAQIGDLEAYVMSLKAPKNAAVADAAIVEKGSRLFSANGCASCHSGTTTTDGAVHWVVGQGNNANIATPSLKLVGSTAPYFHDGRYKDLRTLLTSNDADMGRGRALPSTDLDALEAYLKSL